MKRLTEGNGYLTFGVKREQFTISAHDSLILERFQAKITIFSAGVFARMVELSQFTHA